MKKIITFAFIFVITLCLSGCSEEKLTCTIEEETTKVEMTATFKKDKITSQVVKMSLSDEETASQAYEYMKTINENVKLSGKTITIKATKKELDEADKQSKTQVKTSLEESGYKCK